MSVKMFQGKFCSILVLLGTVCRVNTWLFQFTVGHAREIFVKKNEFQADYRFFWDV